MPTASVARALAGNWSSLALRGVCALLFGVASFMWPGLTVATLVLIWGAYALVDGVLALVSGYRSKIWSLAFIGVIGILAGVGTFIYPHITALVLLYFIAFWAIVTGMTAVYLAIRLRKELTGEWVLALAGLLSAAFGVMLFSKPGEGALTVVFLIACYAVTYGVLLIWLAFKLRGLPNKLAAA